MSKKSKEIAEGIPSKKINKVEELIKKRTLAKANKDFLLADKIRADLRNIGIELIDKPQGLTEWKQLSD